MTDEPAKTTTSKAPEHAPAPEAERFDREQLREKCYLMGLNRHILHAALHADSRETFTEEQARELYVKAETITSEDDSQ